MVMAGVASISAPPPLVRVNGTAEELVETVCLPKLLEVGVKEMLGASPVPLRVFTPAVAPSVVSAA